MRENSVSIDLPQVEYSTEGVFESNISKDKSDVSRELDVTYSDFFPEQKDSVPLSIFSQGISPLQALVKHLKDSQGLNYSEIGRLLNRDPRTIWSTYDAVSQVGLKREDGRKVPLSIFSSRELSILENLVAHLLSEKLSLRQIAEVLGKHYQTIYTVKRRIAEKRGGLDE